MLTPAPTHASTHRHEQRRSMRDETPLCDLAAMLGQRPLEVLARLGVDVPKRGLSRRELRMDTIFGGEGSSTVVNLATGKWFDHNGGEGGDALQMVATVLGVSVGEAAKWAREYLGITRDGYVSPMPIRHPPPPVVEVDAAQEQAWRIGKARECWSDATDPRGTPVEDYLTNARSLPGVLNSDTINSLRYSPNTVFRDGDSYRRAPAMIGAYRDIGATIRALDEAGGDIERAERALMADITAVIGVHRTELTADAKKAGRKMLGAKGGVFISPPSDAVILKSIFVTEGIETALSAYRRGYRSVIALGDAGSIAKLEPIPGIIAITIAKETGAASETACRECIARWNAAGCNVTTIKPVRGSDLNDLDMRHD